jgi:hypothetical protein
VDWEVATLEVEESLRGGVSGRVKVGSAAKPPASQPDSLPVTERSVMMSSCDYRFEEGGRYLVYARRAPDGRLTTSLCSGTKPADEAIEDLAFIQSVPGLPPGGRT